MLAPAGVHLSGDTMESSATLTPALSSDEPAIVLNDAVRAQRRLELEELIELMAPAVRADGGDLVLVSCDVDAGVVHVELVGSCSSCAISSATLEGGVERILRDRLDWVTEIRSGVAASDFEASAALGQGGWVPKATV